MKHDTSARPFVAQGSIVTMNDFQQVPRFYVTQSQAAVPLAVVTVNKDDKGYSQKIEITVPKELQQAPGVAGR